MVNDEQDRPNLATARPTEDGSTAMNEYAQHLRREAAGGAGLRPLLTAGEAEAVTALLGELARDHRGDELGALAGDLAERLRQRLADTDDT